MAAGSAFTEAQRHRVDEAVAAARRQSGLAFSVYVGDPADGADAGSDTAGAKREAAERLFASVAGQHENAVLVMVAPGRRYLEIVTAPAVRERLSDRACALATLSMTSSFSGGDLVGGIVSGLRMLADAAVAPSGQR